MINLRLQEIYKQTKGAQPSANKNDESISSNEVLLFSLELLQSHLLQLALPWLEEGKEEIMDSINTIEAVRSLAVILQQEDFEVTNDLLLSCLQGLLQLCSTFDGSVSYKKLLLLIAASAICRGSMKKESFVLPIESLLTPLVFKNRIIEFNSHLIPPLLQSNSLSLELEHLNLHLK